jgi:hypothetical protein
MGVRAPEPQDAVKGSLYQARLPGASLSSMLILGLVVFCLLVSNGRPIESGDTRVNARLAASLVEEHDFDLDEYPDADFPFARESGGHRVSIYPALPAVLAAPVFFVGRSFMRLDENGVAFLGKLAASLFSALAAALLFAALCRRHPASEARFSALIFALGTAVWSTSQALWQHPAAILFLSAALLCMLKAEDDPAWAGRAGLPLALAVAARHADVALVAVLAVGIAVRWPRKAPFMVVWGLGPALFVAGYQWAMFGSPFEHGFSGTLGRFSEPWGRGQLGLLVSPAKGLLVFTPVVLVAVWGFVRAVRRGERFLPLVLGAGALAHLVLMGRWSEWHGGESFGPRLMSDALPLLFVFLPEGLAATGRVGLGLAFFGVGAQVLGAFADDGRWERLYQRPAAAGHPELWNVRESPLPLYARRGALTFAVPAVRDGRLAMREHPLVLLGSRGSRVSFAAPDRIVAKSADVTLSDLYLMRGARVDENYLRLRGRWDGIFMRVVPEARARRLELRVRGHGKGILYIGESSFWSTRTRFREYPMSGTFRFRHPYYFPESGGPDLTVTVGRAGGLASLDSLALVPSGDPDHVYELR